ncbi:yacL [Symbiodinium necroappetens]|uniref:YacL protein n=1 Tax=Symbiodinium necroappetens TaxID=1628268 RepID=A0A812TD00_9DINO|nr:yacL [Symbiodinium necroappetens]
MDPVRFDPDEHTRSQLIVVKAMRAIFLLLFVVVVSLGLVTVSEDAERFKLVDNWWLVLLLSLGFFGCIVLLDVLTPNRKLSTISAILFGTLAGLLATVVLGFVIDVITKTYQLDEPFAPTILLTKVILGLGLCYLGITTVLQTRDDFRLVIPYVEFTKRVRGVKPLVADTSALIDGRIYDLAHTGMLPSELIIPSFVINELQLLSDSGDRLKRTRGRRGLEMVSRLQQEPRASVRIEESLAAGPVDQLVIDLARDVPATIVTTDVGLAQVAGIQGVPVLNVNDVANALKPNVIPGVGIDLELIRKGEHEGQAVGYLDDGTMVVAENGESKIGQRVRLVVTSTTQTSAGRLIFARLPEDDEAS